MLDPRPVLHICGILLTTLGMVMIVPCIVDASIGNPDWQAFAISALLTGFVGGALILTSRSGQIRMNLRQAFLFTGLSWLSAAAFGALPFVFAGFSIVDSFFEAMSGITTTGSTIMTNLEIAPPGLLLWRSILQWLGGIGIIVVALAFLPMLQVGGMQLFRVEAFDTPEKVLPGAAQIALSIGGAYLLFSLLAFIALWSAGMSLFDAVNHAMTSIATGGFSTHDKSVGHFNSVAIEWIIVVCMIIGSLPFVFLVDALRGNFRPLGRDSQVRWFFAIIVVAVVGVAAWLLFIKDMSPDDAFTKAGFNVIALMTGTGYSTANYNLWGGLPLVVLITLMFVGGCAGSTTCGIKIFRFQVAHAVARTQVARLLQPHGVFIPTYNRQPIADEVASSVMGFFFLFVVCFAALAILLGVLGLDFITAISGAATAIANVGPGMGEIIGPEGNFSTLPDAAKWAMAAAMLLGRLEIYTILILFSPAFWKG